MIDEKRLIEKLNEMEYIRNINSYVNNPNCYDAIMECIHNLSEDETIKENPISSKRFNLLLDSSTFKSWRKDDLIEYIHTLYRNFNNINYDYNCVTNFANELLDEIEHLQTNPPLKFEELHENMWVWDNQDMLYVQIAEDFNEGNGNIILKYYEDSYDSNCERTKFEENRFYRREVKE